MLIFMIVVLIQSKVNIAMFQPLIILIEVSLYAPLIQIFNCFY